MAKRHKHQRSGAKTADPIEQFADCAVEMLRESHHSDLEPFESYAARIKGQMVQQLEEYRGRLMHGYEVLLEEIARESDSRGIGGSPSKGIKP